MVYNGQSIKPAWLSEHDDVGANVHVVADISYATHYSEAQGLAHWEMDQHTKRVYEPRITIFGYGRPEFEPGFLVNLLTMIKPQENDLRLK